MFNAALAICAVGLGAYRLWKHWAVLELGRLVVMALLVFGISTIYGSIEQIVQGTPFGARVMLGTVANFWAIVAFLHSPSGVSDDNS